MIAFDVEEEFLTPEFGLKYIGYPALALVALSVVVAVVSVRSALGLLALAFGYVAVGVGFVITLVAHRRYDVP